MSRKLAAACLTALVLSSAAHADGERYFVNAALGASDGHLDGHYRYSDRLGGTDTAGAVRAGITWQGPVTWGLETGYVDLGKASDQYVVFPANVTSEARIRGVLLGGNATYRFDAPWYVSIRGGLVHGWADIRTSSTGSHAVGDASVSANGNGWYTGVGGGYDISEQFSVGLHYDLYRVRVSGGGSELSGYRSTAMVQLEYRF